MTDDKMREALEAWVKSKGYAATRMINGDYMLLFLDLTFEAYKEGARARIVGPVETIFECTGCGRVTRNPDADLALLRKAGGISCCPERHMVPLAATQARPVDATTDAEQLAAEVKRLADSIDRNFTEGAWLTPGFDVHSTLKLLRSLAAMAKTASEAQRCANLIELSRAFHRGFDAGKAATQDAGRLTAARDALEKIALAGMSGRCQESDEEMRDWHARRAWEFISIAARALAAMAATSPKDPKC